ncbi:MAG: histidinol-phosphatase HisJ family protein [Caldisericia bacterium]|nr:histidinol-phosphatase HisJ family protein [Caldisericia bacterium]
MPKTDLHVHSSVSPDCGTPIANQIQAAEKIGLETIAFTEHWDFDRFNPNSDFLVPQMERKALASIKTSIKVLTGVELGFHKEFEDYARMHIASMPIDFILGSIHQPTDLNISEIGEAKQVFDQFGRKTFDIYFDALMGLTGTLLFDSLAHLDIVKRFALECGYSFKPKEYKSVICDILELLVENDKALEINTSGLRQSPEETFPSFLVVEWFLERNGKYLTVGSDAHRPEHVGKDIDLVNAKLKEMGIKETTMFVNRMPHPVSIE